MNTLFGCFVCVNCFCLEGLYIYDITKSERKYTNMSVRVVFGNELTHFYSSFYACFLWCSK